MSRISLLLLTVTSLMLAACGLFSSQSSSTEPMFAAPGGETAGYPLETCVVSGKPLGTDAVTFTIAGHTFKTCCSKCKTTIESDPTKWAGKLETAITAASATNYPMDTCIVSGRPLTTDGPSLVHEGKLVRFCCAKCQEKFAAEPTAYVPKLSTATSTTFVGKPMWVPTTMCIVSEKPLGADAVTFTAGDHTFRTCCPKCRTKIEADPAQFAVKVDQATIAMQLNDYPLSTCPISGKPLGEMGEPVDLLLDGTLVRLCCAHCVAEAKQNATTVVEKVRAAALAVQRTWYPLTTCPVSGKPLGEDAVSTVVGTTLVRTCCEKCTEKLSTEGAAIVQRVRTMREQQRTAAKAGTCCNTEGKCCCSDGNSATTTTPAAK